MKWESCTLSKKVEVSKDKLGNSIYEFNGICTFLGRFSVFGTDELNALGRDYTSTHRKLISRIPLSKVSTEMIVECNGITYEINSFVGNNRFTVLYISAYKV